MDPLSMTASIIAVVGAGGVIGKGLSKIVALRHAPQILLALNNEIMDLQCVVQDIDNLLKDHSEFTHFTTPTSLNRALEKSRQTLTELESLISYELTSIKGKRNEARLDKSAWLRAEPKAQKFKDEIRNNNMWLASALSLLATSSSIGTNSQVHRLGVIVDTMEVRIGSPSQVFVEQNYDDAGVQDQITTLAHREDGKIQSSIQGIETNAVPSRVSRPPTQSHVPEDVSPASSLVPFQARTRFTKLELSKNSCTSSCDCVCHQRQCFQSPDFLSRFLGLLFVGYTAMPRAKRKCDNSHCHNRSVRMTYIFPSWFWDRAVSVSVESAPTQGPELCLRVMRIRPVTAKSFQVMYAKDAYRHLRRILNDGTGSIFDVDPYGDTGLHWAVNELDLECAKTFVHAGADRYYKNIYGCSPHHVLWDGVLGDDHGFDTTTLSSWMEILGDQSGLEEMGFTRLHKAYLGISAESFEELLASTPRCQIDEVDAGGQTLLHWAARKDKLETLNKLLSCGADPEISDDYGFTPLHRSLWSDQSSATSTLLAAKADVNAKTAAGLTPLHIAAQFHDGKVRIKSLVSYNADVNSRDNHGMTPLHVAASHGYQDNVQCLLEAGAAIDAVDDLGDTPIDRAIVRNSHAALVVLLQYCDQEYLSGEMVSDNSLEIAAYSADVETLEILCSNHIKANIDESTAIEDAEWRRDFNQEWSDQSLQPPDDDPWEWYAAFERLMARIVEPQWRIDDEDASEAEGDDEDDDEDEDEDEDEGEEAVAADDPNGAGKSEATYDQSDSGEVWEDAPEFIHSYAK